MQGRLACQIRAGGGCMRDDCLKYLKRGVTEKRGRGRETKIFKSRGQAASRDGALKRGRLEAP